MHLTVLRFPSFSAAVKAQAALQAELPQALVSLPVQFHRPKIK
jgi:hypothetical protein